MDPVPLFLASRTGPTEASAAAVRTEVAKLVFLRGLDAHSLDLSGLPAERRRHLAAVGRRSSIPALTRDLIHQRTMAGLAAARAQGRIGGRSTVLDRDKLAAARARLARGEATTEIAKALAISRATLYRHIDVAAARARHQ
jgi:hypothetical protein